MLIDLSPGTDDRVRYCTDSRFFPNQIDYKYQFAVSKYHFFHSFLKTKVDLLLLLTSPNNKIESEMTYNNTATLDKLACTDYVDFVKCQDRFGQISWSKNSFDYLDVKLKVFMKEENKHFRLAQNLTMGEADFKQFI